MSDRSDLSAVYSRRTAARLLVGGTVAGLAPGVASASSSDDTNASSTLAFHCPYGKRVDYAFETTGEVTPLDHAPHLDIPDGHVSADRGTAIEDGVATGAVNGGYDVFAYEGDLVAFAITSGDCADLELRDSGDSVDACELVAQLPAPGEESGDAPTVLTSCTTIDEPGYYVLGGDLGGGDAEDGDPDVCLEIAADDVVLGGRGHAIDGGMDGSVGLRVTGSDAVVRDIEVLGWNTCVSLRGERTLLERATLDNGDRSIEGSPTGLDVSGTGCTIRDVEALGRDVGALLDGATDAVLADCSITGLTLGIVMDGATGCVVRNTGAGSGGSEGLVMNSSHDNLIVGNGLGGLGIGVSVTASHRNTVRDNEFGSDGDYALAISNCEELALLDNDASDLEAGIALQDVTDSVLRDNVVDDTNNTGIQLRGGSGNVLAENQTNRNQDAGIELDGVAETVLFGNEVRENSTGRSSVGGIYLVDADRNAIVRNTVCENGGPAQINVEGSSSGNRITGNDTTC